MDYVVGWGTLALINAAIANADRRSPLLYFLASLVFGPLITLILAATRETENGRLRQVDVLRGRGRRDRDVPSLEVP